LKPEKPDKKFKEKRRVKTAVGADQSGSHDLFTTWAVVVVLALVFALWLYIQVQWWKRPPLSLPTVSVFPPISDIVQNVRLMFHGYKGGYLRTIIGYSVFAMMAASFLSFGRILLGWIFKESLQEQMSFLERVSLSYILGSLFGSLLWLGLGSSGFLNFHMALWIGVGGLVLFLVQFFSCCGFGILKGKARSWRQEFTVTEKSLSLEKRL
jgi:hypothetical protein